MENFKFALFVILCMMGVISCTSNLHVTAVSEHHHHLDRTASNAAVYVHQTTNTFIGSKYLPYDGPAAVPGDVGPASTCAVTNTEFIASAPPDEWANGAACGTMITVTCFAAKDKDACSSTPTTPVQIVDQSCTDCGELYYISRDAFYTIAAGDASEVAITVQ